MIVTLMNGTGRVVSYDYPSDEEFSLKDRDNAIAYCTCVAMRSDSSSSWTVVEILKNWMEPGQYVMGKIKSYFAPGFSLEEEHIAPVWDTIMQSHEVMTEDTYDTVELRQEAFNRTINVFRVILYGD